jgi:Fic family protein
VTRPAAPPGHRVPLAGGAWAHVPAPLPPALDWTPALVAALSEADRLIGRLAGEGGRLPNPHLLIRLFLRREAVLSSKIEGTQATLGELLAAEAGMAVDRSPADLHEVGNYVVALEHGIKRLKTIPLSLRLIRELHAKLMTGVRGDHASPGHFRETQNWIGRPGSGPAQATYVPPPPGLVMPCLDAWEKFLHDRSLPPLVQIALAHYQFEAIHPFRDGNGRVGRLLITLFLVGRGILPTPLLYLSAFFEARRQEYYARLQGVHARAEWEPWFAYFLEGVASQSEDALSRTSRINTLLAKWRDKVVDAGLPAAVRLLDVLAENPYCTVRGAAARLKVAFTTAQRAVAKLEELKIVRQVNEAKRDRVYCATGLLKILEEPAKVAGQKM